MSNTYNDKDLIIPKVRINSTNNTILFNENGVHYSASLSVGDYYCYFPDAGESTAFQTAYPSLYVYIAAAITSEAVGSFSLTVATPTLSNGFSNSGIALVRTAGTHFTYGPILTSSANTFDPRYLGFNTGDTTTTQTSDIDLTGSYSRYGVWMSPKQHSFNIAGYIKNQYHNSGNRKVKQTVYWNTDKIRAVHYNYVFANHISSYRNNNLDYAEAGYQPLSQYDHGNYWNDCWEQLSRGDDAIIIYNDGDVDLSIINHSYEIVSLSNENQDELDSTRTITQNNAEIYDIKIKLNCKLYKDAKIEFPLDVTNYYQED